MTDTDLGFGAIAVVLLASTAWSDARRFTIEPWAGIALAVTGLAWHGTTASDLGVVSTAWWMPALGLAIGVAAAALPIGVAEMRARPWPLMPGDGILLGAIGALVGPVGLAWSVLAGTPIALAHRGCLQRKRNRPFRSGYAPLAPGLAAGALAVLTMLAAGVAVAQEDEVLTEGPGDTLSAVVLAPEIDPGPPGAAEAPVAITADEPLTLPELAARIEAATGRSVTIEERPSRTGVAAALDTAPPLAIDYEGPLAGLLDRMAAGHRYRWEWRHEAIVFYRYWDAEFALLSEPLHEPAPVIWKIDRERHPTLKAVLESWAGDAGWSLIWSVGRDYSLAADAIFEGTFLATVDSVLSDPATSGTLTATAYKANRQLVIEEVP